MGTQASHKHQRYQDLNRLCSSTTLIPQILKSIHHLLSVQLQTVALKDADVWKHERLWFTLSLRPTQNLGCLAHPLRLSFSVNFFWVTYPRELEAGSQKEPCSQQHHSQRPKGGNNPSIHWQWTDKQNMVCTYNGILSSLKNEWNSDTYYDMDEPWGHYAKWNKPASIKSTYLE